MSDEIARLLVRVEANAQHFEAQMKKINQTLKVTQAANRKTFERMRNDTTQAGRRLGTDLNSGLKSALMSSAGVIAAALSASAIKEYADSYTRYTNQLKVAGLEGQQLVSVQEQLFSIAQKYGVQVESLGALYGKLTQAGKELGASQAELLQFSTGVAAALKVTGGTAASTSGALTQLSQALGGEIVRAEEFNSINEGARPILVAVANGIERYHGSVAALRREVIDGKVTSQEFFQGFLRGSKDLEEQAAKANLTIAASFTVLNNALGKYIGEADQNLSATQKLSQAIQGLANNLDVLIPAMILIAGVIGARYAGALAVGAVANARMFAAVVGVTAAISGQTVAMTAAQAAALGLQRALLAAFGGPVGLAIAAISGALLYAVTQGNAAAVSARELKRAEDSLAPTMAVVEENLKKAAGASDDVRKAHLAAADAALIQGRAEIVAARQAVEAGRAKVAALEEERKARANAGGYAAAKIGNPAAYTEGAARLDAAEARLNGLETAQINAGYAKRRGSRGRGTTLVYRSASELLAEKESASAPSTAGGTGKATKAKADKGPTAEDLARKREDIRLDQAQAVAQAAGDEARIRALEDEAFIRQRTQAYRDAGSDADSAERQAIMDRIALRNAEADAAARVYGLTPATVDGNPNLVDSGIGKAGEDLIAQEDAMRDTFRRTFGDGVRAALQGDLQGFFLNLADRFTDRLIDNLSDQLFNLLNEFSKSQQGSGSGNWFSTALHAFSGFFQGGGNYAGGFATGGSFGAGQWATVGENGPEAIYGKPGGGVQVLSNGALRSMRSQMSRPMPQAGGGVTINTTRFELNSPVMTQDLLAEMEARNAAAQRQMAGQLAKASRRALPELQGRQSTLGYIG